MIWSVWDQGKGAYDYFESPEPNMKQNAPKPAHLRSRTLGATVEQAAWPLPAGARQVGSGAAAVGRIATSKSAASLGDITGDLGLVKAGLLAASAYLVWKYVVKGPRRRTA